MSRSLVWMRAVARLIAFVFVVLFAVAFYNLYIDHRILHDAPTDAAPEGPHSILETPATATVDNRLNDLNRQVRDLRAEVRDLQSRSK